MTVPARASATAITTATTSAPAVILVDAAVLACAVVDDGGDGALARHRLAAADTVLGLDGIDQQVSVLVARLADTGRLSEQRAEQAIADLAELPLERVPAWPFLVAAWSLRDSCGPRSGEVTVAAAFGATYVTADSPLAAQAADHCRVELLSRPPG